MRAGQRSLSTKPLVSKAPFSLARIDPRQQEGTGRNLADATNRGHEMRKLLRERRAMIRKLSGAVPILLELVFGAGRSAPASASVKPSFVGVASALYVTAHTY